MSALLTIATVLACAGVPQGPAAPAPNEPMAPGLELVPAQTHGVVWLRTGAAAPQTLAGVTETFAALARHGANPLPKLTAHLEQMLQLPAETVADLAERGITLAWLADRPDATEEWLLVAELPEQKGSVTWTALPRRLQEAGHTVRTVLAQGTEVHAVLLGNAGTFSFAVRGRRLLAASRPEAIEAALARKPQESLAATPAWTAFAQRVGTQARPVFGGWLHGRALLRALSTLHPATHHARLQALYESQMLHRSSSLGFAMTEHGERLEQLWVWGLPGTRGDLLRGISEPRAAVVPGVAAFVPQAAIGWMVGRATPSLLFEHGIGLLRIYAPQHAEATSAWFDGLRSSRGVSAREDLLGTLGDQFVFVEFPPRESQPTQAALLLDVHDSWKLRNALQRLVADRTLPVATQRLGELELHQLLIPDLVTSLPIWFTVTSRHLVLATSEHAARGILAQLGAPAPNPAVAAALAQPVANVQWQGSTRWDACMRTFLAVVGRPLCAEDPDLPAALGNLALEDGSQVFARLFVDDDAFQWQVVTQRPDPGFLTGVLVAARHLGRRLGMAGETVSQGSRSVADVLAMVAHAQRRLREFGKLDANGDGAPEFGTLVDLAVAGLIDIEELGQDLGDGLFEREGMLLTLLLPETADGREQQFAMVAWPARSQVGRVLAATVDHDRLYNDLIAGVKGIHRMDPRELWLGGWFGDRMTSGWRQLDGTQADGTAGGQPSDLQDMTRLTTQERELYERIVALETQPGARAPKEVIDALGSPKPALAARAARLLGMLRAVDAVPKLCETVSVHADPEVQRHAMAALRTLKDRRSVQVSTFALGSDDATLRALAAANLGDLREKSAVRPLLAMISVDGETQVDRMQALVALADIGDPAAMLPAAQAVRTESGDLAEAVAYLVATLAPKLPPEAEAEALLALLDHPSMLVRRHSIQRLGQLKVRSTATALQGRLATEDDAALRPLIEVALRSLHGNAGTRDDEPGAWIQIKEWVSKQWVFLRGKWEALPQERQITVGGVAVGVLLTWLLLRALRRGRRRRAEVEHLTALVAPSEEYTDSHEQAGREYGDLDAPYRRDEEEQFVEEIGAGGGSVRLPARPPEQQSNGPWHPY